MMMTTKFEIDKEFLRNEAKSTKHKENSAWFFSNSTYAQKENFKKRHSKKYKNYNKYKPQHHKNPTKQVIKCFKCGKVGHIAPNCKNQKINAISDKDYYS